MTTISASPTPQKHDAATSDNGPETRAMICIACPIGCELTVTETAPDSEAASDTATTRDGRRVGYIIRGNRCKRGIAYAVGEMTNPTRILTTTVTLIGRDRKRHSLPVRSYDAIPWGDFPEALAACHDLVVQAPVRMGQILIEDLGGSGIPLVASRDWS